VAGLGLCGFPKRCAGPGTKGFASTCLCFLVLNLQKQVQGIAKGPRTVFTSTRSYAQKKFFEPPGEELVVPSSSQKDQILTSIG
jgi:hypothetical protein